MKSVSETVGRISRKAVKTVCMLLTVLGILLLTGYPGTCMAEAQTKAAEAQTKAAGETSSQTDAAEETETKEVYPAPEFEMRDQYGKLHKLSDYKGKVVFLNIWATWCPPCRAEMPDIQKLYTEFQEEEQEDVVILGVAFPNRGKEQDIDGITAFMTLNGYTYPTLMDVTGEVLEGYYITAYPTTYMIDRDGNLYGYVTGSMTEDVMRDIIDQTLNKE